MRLTNLNRIRRIMTGGSITAPAPARLALILGGARSGKSAFAEKLVIGSRLPRLYIATATRSDAEMAARIDRHRSDRANAFTTTEVPLDLAAALRGLAADATVLVDCATLWLSNHMIAGHDCDVVSDDLVAALTACPARIVIVSNEVGSGIVPDTPLGRQFRDAQGRLNQRLAARADTVAFVVAGLPMVLKGSLPVMT
jgi:adenosylcobinamide kinase / adenosylcobinamide-phosphate guanylyltransferase